MIGRCVAFSAALMVGAAACAVPGPPHKNEPKVDCRVAIVQPKRWNDPVGWFPLDEGNWKFDIWMALCGGRFQGVKSPKPKNDDPFFDVQVILNDDCTLSSTSNLSDAEIWRTAKFEIVN